MTYGVDVHPLRSGSRSRLLVRQAAAVTTAGALLAAGSVTAAVAAPAITGPAVAPADLAPFYAQTLTWRPCADGMTCAWLTVPLDYADPAGSTVRLRIARVTATGPAEQRQGSLVVNPGGPGASGTEFASYVASSVVPSVARAFDVVGFDPRGVGESAPITCMTGVQTTRWLRADPSPDTAAEERRLMSLARRLGQGCLRMSPEVARHVGTEDTVADLDILRQALGDERLNWFGFSYGTYLGTLFAERFPDRVGRFVLDGAVDPSLDVMEISRGQSTGFQRAMRRFAADCSGRSTCPYGGSTNAVLRGINRLLDRVDAAPMATRGPRDLVQAEALTALFYSMYSPTIWSSLRLALRQAANGNGSGLQFIADFATERIGPNRYASNMASAFPAIACWDSPSPPGAGGLKAAARTWSRGVGVPEMARAMSWGNAPCSQWYGHAIRVPAPATTTTTSPILVVGTTYDPATPYEWAVQLSRQLHTSTLLTYRGDGHTASGAGSRCIDGAVSAYLLTGVLPAAGTVCS